MQTLERTIAYVDLGIIDKNYKLLKDWVGKKTKVMAVVKANAYGHGLIEVAKKLEQIGTDYFGVASLLEAIELRQSGIKGEILIFGNTDSLYVDYLHQYNLIQTVSSLVQAQMYNNKGIKIRVHINVDTGMSRFGISCHNKSKIAAATREIEMINMLENCDIEGIYTHFSIAERRDDNYTFSQFETFKSLVNSLEQIQISIPLKHCCNSSATLLYPYMHMDMVRCGIALYGLPHVNTNLQLTPAMTLKAKVVALRTVEKGESVSYGRTFFAPKNITVATIAIGYAEGYFRTLSNLDYVLFNNQKLNVIGVVCMDAMMVDATGANLKEGDFVEVFGQKKTASDVARLANTIDYEILTNISSRVERVYLDSFCDK